MMFCRLGVLNDFQLVIYFIYNELSGCNSTVSEGPSVILPEIIKMRSIYLKDSLLFCILCQHSTKFTFPPPACLSLFN